MEQIFTKLNDGWNAEPNAPYPTIETFASTLELTFLANPWQFPAFSEGDKIVLTFKGCTQYRLGSTNSDGWYMGQCRFSGLAPLWGEFYEIKGLTWDHRARGWTKMADWLSPAGRHFLFYFRDETFECKAADWSMRMERLEDKKEE